MGIRVGGPISRRLLERTAKSFDLDVVRLSDDDIHVDTLFDLEMIIADEQVARDLRPLVKEQQVLKKPIIPAFAEGKCDPWPVQHA